MSRFASIANRPTTRRTVRKPIAPAIVTSNVPVKRPASKTACSTNLAGGAAFKMTEKSEFVTAVLGDGLLRTGKNAGTYESPGGRRLRIAELVPIVTAYFAAETALSARRQHGLRSISHFVAAHVAVHCRGEEWAANFFDQICVRIDDAQEIAACYWAITGKKGVLTNAMKKGFSRFFSRQDRYRLAKYASKPGSPRVVDLVNLCHPKPTAKNAAAFKALMKGTLKNEDTWEARLSKAGQTGEQSKKEVWAEMVNEGLMGQLGLLRNLRNIAADADEKTVREACKQLTNPESIKKSGILPFQYLKAYEVLGTLPKHREMLQEAVDLSVELSVGNVPSLGDRVLLAIDESGSMGPLERDNASLFAAVLLKSNPNADVMFFAGSARYQHFNRRLPILELQRQIRQAMQSGSTSFPAIFRTADKSYDSIVILSDQEGWIDGGAPVEGRATYEKLHGCKPTIFCFDLTGDGKMMFREDSIILLSGFSFGVFKLLNILRQERNKLVDQIAKIVIGQPVPSIDQEDDEG